MKKWGVISKFEFFPRFEFLSDYLKSKHSFENEFSALDCEPENFFEKLEEWKTEFDQFRVGAPFGSLLAENLDLSNALTLTLKTADCLHHLDSRWWPRSLMDECLLRAVIQKDLNIDIHNSAMIIGTGAAAKACVMSLVKLGFLNISFTDTNSESGYEFVSQLKRRVFGANFNFIEQRDIALLPGVFSLAINTPPDMVENTLVDDLSFFNYLRHEGIVIDLSVKAAKTKFIKQAELVTSQVLHGIDVASLVDAYWVEMCFDIELNESDYKSELTSFLSTH